MTMVTDAVGDQVSKSSKRTAGGFGPTFWYARNGHLVIGVPSTLDQSPVRDRNL